MAKIVIKKKISLEFLGEDYKDDYLVFKSLSVSEYEGLLDKLEAVKEDGKKSLQFISEILDKQFLEGQFQNEKVEKQDLKDFDLETLTQCFELFTGRRTDPKA